MPFVDQQLGFHVGVNNNAIEMLSRTPTSHCTDLLRPARTTGGKFSRASIGLQYQTVSSTDLSVAPPSRFRVKGGLGSPRL